MTCPATWHGLVRHQCDRLTGHEGRHHCPCGVYGGAGDQDPRPGGTVFTDKIPEHELPLADDDREAQAETSEHIARLAGPVDLGFPAPGYMRPASSDQSDDSGTPAQAEET